MHGASRGNERSRWQAVILAVGTIALIIATLTDLLDLIGRPLFMVIGVLALAVIAFAIFFIAQRPSGLRDKSFFMAIGSMACAALVLVVVTTSVVTLAMHPERGPVGKAPPQVSGPSTSQEVQGGGLASPLSSPQNSSAPVITTSPATPELVRYRGEITLSLNMGVDLDSNPPELADRQAAAGRFDIALKYYGNLHAIGKGWYMSAGNDREACRDALSAPQAYSEVLGAVGAKYCFKTSEGYPGYMEVSLSTFLGYSGPKKVTMAITVWEK